MSNIQALVDALKNIESNIIEEKELGYNRFRIARLIDRIHSAATQALADYHKSKKEDEFKHFKYLGVEWLDEPEASNSDEATVATLRSSSPNSIEQERDRLLERCKNQEDAIDGFQQGLENMFGLEKNSCPFFGFFKKEYERKFYSNQKEDGGKGFAKFLEECTRVIYEDKITLYRYHDSEGWGNYILDDIYEVYKDKYEPETSNSDIKSLASHSSTPTSLLDSDWKSITELKDPKGVILVYFPKTGKVFTYNCDFMNGVAIQNVIKQNKAALYKQIVLPTGNVAGSQTNSIYK